jgi:hypothetical protein
MHTTRVLPQIERRRVMLWHWYRSAKPANGFLSAGPLPNGYGFQGGTTQNDYPFLVQKRLRKVENRGSVEYEGWKAPVT